ncbi:MAG: ATP-binding protein, partial [Candidatus Cloacimonas sp.]
TKLIDGRIMLVVEDNGCGMDQETLSRATEPFFSSKEIGQGTGLGLSLAHSIVLNSKGNMTMESELGKGTSVSLSFPVEDHYEKQ